MHIIHIASELAPLAKVGGLADVVLGLSRELSWKGHDIDIIIPYYDCIDSNQIRDLSIVTSDLLSYYNGEWIRNVVWMGWVENLKVYFIDPHHHRYFFNRGCFYGCEDDIERYLYFSRAAIEFIYKMQLNPDIIHLHDWQTAAIAPLYYNIYQEMGLTKPKIVFTIHNFEYQGKCATADLDRIGLKGDLELSEDKLQDPENTKIVNLMKGGIVYANYITTVSPTYAQEVLTTDLGRGLQKTLLKHKDKFSGILNGIDYSYWNPEIDRYLPSHYSPREIPANKKDHSLLNNKAYIKRFLRERLTLDDGYKPIVSCITRLVPQKGIDLIEHALNYCLEHQGQFILLGSSPIPAIQEKFHALQMKYHDHPNVHLTLHHQEELAHLIYAGSDIFIVPSIFEPCGLTQMIALKYGSIPVVRRTGGLADTIFDVDDPSRPSPMGNGYVFDDPTQEAFEGALSRAFERWFNQPEEWRQLLIHGMQIDYSWNHPSNEYLNIYSTLCGKKEGSQSEPR